MSNVIKIPMPDSIFDELDDAFIDAKETAHDFVWGLIRSLCRDAKLGKLNKICTVNVIKDGVPTQDQIKLKGYELEIVENNLEWIPQNMEKEDVKYFEHKITDKTWEYIKLYASFAILRHQKYADSIELENERKLADMVTNNADDKIITDAKDTFAKTVTKFREATPKCIEEILFNALFPSIHKRVTENIETEFDKENEEMYPKVVTPSAK